MPKKKTKESKSKQNDKKVITIKVPSFDFKKNGWKYAVGVLGILLAVSLFFNLRGGLSVSPTGKMALSGLIYMCPPENCDTSQVEEWSGDLGYEVSPYEAIWSRGPIGLLFDDNSVELLDVSTEAGFYQSVCESTDNERACEISSDAEEKQAQQSCETLTKVEKPELDAFVVSYCPFGLQMQRILIPVFNGIGEGADINIRYMGQIIDGEVTAMHGEEEAQENLKQICIREEQPDKYWEYVECFIKGEGRSETCSDEVGINTDKLEECIAGEKGLEYAEEDFELQVQYGVTGSPTLIMNGERVSEFNFGGRTAEAVKTMICCAMEDPIDECGQKLSTEQANTAFAET